jgi:hypothetical protein
MFAKDSITIQRRIQFGCFIVTTLTYSFIHWIQIGFSPLYWIRAIPFTYTESILRYCIFTLCFAVVLFINLLVQRYFREPRSWLNLLFGLLIGFNLSYLVLAFISVICGFSSTNWYLKDIKTLSFVFVLANLTSLIPTLIIWSVSFGIYKLSKPKNLH